MTNMDYCRFQNTVQDLEYCYEHITDRPSSMSEEEDRARQRLIKICKDIVEESE